MNVRSDTNIYLTFTYLLLTIACIFVILFAFTKEKNGTHKNTTAENSITHDKKCMHACSSLLCEMAWYVYNYDHIGTYVASRVFYVQASAGVSVRSFVPRKVNYCQVT